MARLHLTPNVIYRTCAIPKGKTEASMTLCCQHVCCHASISSKLKPCNRLKMYICVFMCGIAGIVYLNDKAKTRPENGEKVLKLLKHRGPDHQSYVNFSKASLYHSRLQIVDATAASNQPFLSEDGKTGMVYNGEVFNYQVLKKNIPDIQTNGDVEVLFKLLRREGLECLDKLNGFFAFAFFDERTNSLLIARDRFGIKPLYYFKDEAKLAFASELKPLLELVGPQEINPDQVYTYFRLNYCAGKQTIFRNIYRLLPGECIELKNGAFEIRTWYKAPLKENNTDLESLLEDAVKIRLHADVPLGTFLSGGLDSSIISAIAKKHKPDLNTFSIGFANEAYFDESRYSEMVAKHIGSSHHAYKLTEEDFLKEIDGFLNCIDEPFADSSAFNFYVLSKQTQKHVKVALSGDGADELFKGYHKHRALLMANSQRGQFLAKTSGWIPGGSGSRQGFVQNKMRQLKKFGQLAKLDGVARQKFLACISDDTSCRTLIKRGGSGDYFDSLFHSSVSLNSFNLEDTFDIQTVLADDMLVKADRFSMQQGLEIRNPFLDYRVVEFALNLDKNKKITRAGQKLILRDIFKNLLPAEILTRSKKGFELPLQKWLSHHLRSTLENDWLRKEKMLDEGLLDVQEVNNIMTRSFSSNPGDSAASLWAIIVFEAWLQNFRLYIKTSHG